MLTELRAQQVIIETPRLGSEPFISVVIQRVTFKDDGTIAQTINRERMLTSSLAKRALEICPIVDPINPPENFISVVGVGIAIEYAVRSWIHAEYPESYIEGDRVLIDDNNS